MKSLTPTVDSAFVAENIPLLILIDLHFMSGHVYLCNAAYDFFWNGNTYLGAANCGSIEEIQDSCDLSMSGIKLTLTGVDPVYISTALNEDYQGRPCTIWVAALDADYQILNDPCICFRGRLDVMEIEMGERASINVTAESRLTDWNQSDARRYTNEDQIIDFPNDRFFEFVNQMVEKELLWGVPSPSVPSSAPVTQPSAGNGVTEWEGPSK